MKTIAAVVFFVALRVAALAGDAPTSYTVTAHTMSADKHLRADVTLHTCTISEAAAVVLDLAQSAEAKGAKAVTLNLSGLDGKAIGTFAFSPAPERVNPMPTSDAESVWVVGTSRVYHCNRNCSTLARSNPSQAEPGNRRPCKVCCR